MHEADECADLDQTKVIDSESELPLSLPKPEDEHAQRDLRTFLRRTRRASALLSALIALAGAKIAEAKPGTHPLVVSTWDARASSVVLGYRNGSFDGGGFNIVGYHANFSSTSGVLSSQFGLYYENYHDKQISMAHGLAASAVALFNLPVMRRFDNGLPMIAVDLYLGAAPVGLINGERNYFSIPFVFGAGVPITPVKYISIVPWFELSPSINLDTVIKPYQFTAEDIAKYYDAKNNTIRNLTAADVENLVNKSVELKTTFAVGARGGLDLSLHASDSFDFNVNAALSSVGSAFSGPRVLYLGGGLTWRWDDIVPAVLPAEKRLLHESCDDVEARFTTCPNSRKWKKIEGDPAAYGPMKLDPGTPTKMPAASTPTPAPTPSAPPVTVTPAAPNAAPPPPPPPPAPSSTNGSSEPSAAFPTQD